MLARYASWRSGENIGDTPTHVLFLELKERAGAVTEGIGPQG
jgi:hypothetical protein